MKYKDYIDIFKEEKNRKKRYYYKMKAKKYFPDRFNVKDFPRKRTLYSDWVKRFDNSVKAGDKFKQSWIRNIVRNKFPEEFDMQDFPYSDRFYIPNYEAGLKIFYKQKTARMRYHIKCKLKIKFPNEFNENDFDDKRKRRSE